MVPLSVATRWLATVTSKSAQLFLCSKTEPETPPGWPRRSFR